MSTYHRTLSPSTGEIDGRHTPKPYIECDLAYLDLTDRIGHAVPLRHQDIDLGTLVTISSGLCRFLCIRVLLLAQTQLEDGPFLRRWITGSSDLPFREKVLHRCLVRRCLDDTGEILGDAISEADNRGIHRYLA